MSAVITVVPRTRPVTALRVLLGTTSKDEIQAFCPKANVGYAAGDPLDIRWVFVPHTGSLRDEMRNDGDWIVQRAPGQYFILTDTEFHREYVIA
jgi:hypothetical protein